MALCTSRVSTPSAERIEVNSMLYNAGAPSLPASQSMAMAAADSLSSSASDDDSLGDSRTRLRSSWSQSCSLPPWHMVSLISTSLKYTAELKKDVVAAVGMELNECPLFTLDADHDINLFCETDFCISLNKFKFGSTKAIEGFAQALVENIWRVQGKEIAADPTGWLVCSPAYRFVPVSAVLLSRRVHKLLADRCVAEGPANQVPTLLELYRGNFRGGGGQEYASLGRECREKMMPSFTVRATPVAPLGIVMTVSAPSVIA